PGLPNIVVIPRRRKRSKAASRTAGIGAARTICRGALPRIARSRPRSWAWRRVGAAELRLRRRRHRRGDLAAVGQRDTDADPELRRGPRQPDRGAAIADDHDLDVAGPKRDA